MVSFAAQKRTKVRPPPEKYFIFPLHFGRLSVELAWADMDAGCGESPPVNPAHRCQPVLLLGFPPVFVLQCPPPFFMEDTNSLIEQRKAKLASLRAKGIDPFQNKFTPTETCKQARDNYAEGREVSVAGRITAHRDMGKSMFIDVRDQSGRLQVYAQKNVLGDEQFAIFTHLDLADFIGVQGTLFTTKTGEISIKLDRKSTRLNSSHLVIS